jgi:hypothetical protein
MCSTIHTQKERLFLNVLSNTSWVHYNERPLNKCIHRNFLVYFYFQDSLYLWKYFFKKKKIFTTTQSLRSESAFQKSTAFSWPLILVMPLTLGLSPTHRVELPITNQYLITEHFFRSSSSVLYFEWFKMLWERYLKLWKSFLKCKGKGVMKK